jgi:hypothetical protein
MYGYIACYNGKQIEIYASSSYEAQRKAVLEFKAPKSKAHTVSVHLCEKQGEPVVHSTASI